MQEIEKTTIELPALTATSGRGFGVAISPARMTRSAVYWYENEEAFHEAFRSAKQIRAKGDSTAAGLDGAQSADIFPTTQEATRALYGWGGGHLVRDDEFLDDE